MSHYDPTINPGDTRTRCHALVIRIPNGGIPTVEIHEEEVIRTADGERNLPPVGSFTREVDMAEVFPVRNPVDDALLGSDATVAQAMALIYSWVRTQQETRDAATSAVP